MTSPAVATLGAATAVGEWMQAHAHPIVAIISTPEAEETCLRNNLSFLELITPFAQLSQPVTVRTVSDPYQVRDFTVRLAYMESLRSTPIPEEISDKQLASVVASRPPSPSGVGTTSDSDKVLDALRTSAEQFINAADPTPWFSEYRRGFIDALRCAPHQALDYPVCCMLVASTRSANPINAFMSMFNQASPPGPWRSGAIDTNVYRMHVLLHDQVYDNGQLTEQIFSRMKATFGPSTCRMLPLNSLTERDANTSSIQPWLDVKRGASPPSHASPAAAAATPASAASLIDDVPAPSSSIAAAASLIGGAGDDDDLRGSRRPGSAAVYGKYLSDKDVANVQLFMTDFITRGLLASMEGKVNQLNEVVSEKRRGLMKQVSKWWRSKPKEETVVTAAGERIYGYESTEAQIRQLAALAFLMRDYELAASNYRLAASDFRNDRAWLHCAGAMEMLGLSTFLVNGTRRDIDSNLEGAYTSFLKASAVRYATQTAILHSDICQAREGYREATEILLPASSEESDLRTALLLEQAALCFARMQPVMRRKFSFHMVLAGHKYGQAGQRHSTIRCYLTALLQYQGKDWDMIEDHIFFTLGRQCSNVAMHVPAIDHFLHLLSRNCQTARRQESYMKELVYIYRTAASARPASAPIPPLRLPVPAVVPGSVALALHDMWLPMPEPGARQRWADLATKVPASLRPSTAQRCVVGEAMAVEVLLRNTLAIAYDLSQVRLAYKHSDSGDDYDGDDGDGGDGGYGDGDGDGAAVQLTAVDVRFTPEQAVRVRLEAQPQRVGKLRLTGIRFLLNGTVPCFIPLPDPGSVDIVAAAPRLTATLTGVPTDLLHGQVVEAQLELRNVALHVAVSSCVLVVSHPAWLTLSPSHPNDAVAQGTAELMKSPHVLPLDRFAPLPGSASLTIPLWLRACDPGKTTIYLLLAYAPDAGAPARVVRTAVSVVVQPSLRFGVSVREGSSSLQHSVLGVEVDNSHAGSQVVLEALTLFSGSFNLEPLTFGDDHAADKALFSIAPGQVSTLYLRLIRDKDGEFHRDRFTRCCVDLAPGSGQDTDEATVPQRHDAVGSAFLFLLHAKSDAAAAALAKYRPRPGDPPKPANQRSPYLVSNSEALYLVLTWRCANGTRGMHIVSRGYPRPPAQPSASSGGGSSGATAAVGAATSSSSVLAPVKVLLDLPGSLTHDFALAGDIGCVADAFIDVRNLTAAPMLISVTGLHQRDSGTPLGYVWLGVSQRHAVYLAPDKAVRLPARICFLAPGVYEVSDIEVRVLDHGDGVSPDDPTSSATPADRARALAARSYPPVRVLVSQIVRIDALPHQSASLVSSMSSSSLLDAPIPSASSS